MTKQHSLLLSQPLIPPTLRHEKTVTRRTPSCTNSLVDGRRISGKAWKALGLDFTSYVVYDGFFGIWSNKDKAFVRVAPIYKQGDTIWFKEKYRRYYPVDENMYTDFSKEIIEYAADNPPMIQMIDADGWHMFNKDGSEKFIPWRASIFMPKSAARLWATCGTVTCERLHDITEEQAKREGVDWEFDQDFGRAYKNYSPGFLTYELESAVESFKTLWASINGWDSWPANPPVYVIPFELIPEPEVLKEDVNTMGE